MKSKNPRISASINKNPRSSASTKRGFSLIEVMIVAGIAVIISVVAFVSLSGRRNITQLNTAGQQVVTLLREAQGRSISGSESGAAWGVHLDNVDTGKPFYALFRTAYVAANVVGQYPLPSNIRYATTSIAAGGSLDITFAQISGVPSTSTTITLELYRGGSAGGTSESVSRNSSGRIFFDDFNRTNL